MPDTVPYQSLSRTETLTARLIRQIETLMTEQHLQPGDRLPPERELAQRFGVSRTVLREAVAALAAKGLLEPLPTGGARVRVPDAQTVSQSLSLLLHTGRDTYSYARVHEVRRLLEVEIAGLAALRRNDDDLLTLEETVQVAEGQDLNQQRFAEADVAFHAALARATGNQLFCLLLDALADVLLRVRAQGFAVPGTQARAARHHRAILEQVRRGASEEARLAMLAHLREAEQTQQQLGLIAPDEESV